MKRLALLKTTLAAAITLALLMTTSGCFWGHDDHHDDRGHADDHHDDHQDDHH
jgi:hypothetical protein